MKEEVAVKDLTVNDFRNALYKRFDQSLLFWAIIAMIISYFYNLPVMTYAAVGENELRLYDVAGIILIYYYFSNFEFTYLFIKSQPFLRSMHLFIVYCIFTLMFTAIASILRDKYLYFFSAVLYLYHLAVFFLTAVYMSILMRNPKNLSRFVSVALFASGIAFLIVILQNLDILPFLWNDSYKSAYSGFLSGTFGPNKIVVGISSLFMFILSISLINEKRVTLNKTLVLINAALSLITLIMSGSRTAYLGGAIFVFYYLIKQPINFINSAVASFCLFLIILIVQPEIINKTAAIFENRVEKKIRDKDDLREAKVGNLYEDLGAGRNIIFKQYIGLLADEYYIIPFGKGFNNRASTASSAHNMYLSLVYELGLVGAILYGRWLLLYLFVRMKKFKNMETALHGLIICMLVTLFFGEHLYIYRPLFALLGLFLFVVTILTAPMFLVENEKK